MDVCLRRKGAYCPQYYEPSYPSTSAVTGYDIPDSYKGVWSLYKKINCMK